jgi:hypothetical protein
LSRFEVGSALFITRIAQRNAEGELTPGISPEMERQEIRMARESFEVFIDFAQPGVFGHAIEVSEEKIAFP